MSIYFNQIQPAAFNFNHSSQSIWGNEVGLTQGNVYQILASSGSGKSTFVSFIAGLRGDYSGDISINNKKISAYHPKEWSKWRSKDASFVFQDLRLFPELTVIDNINIINDSNITNEQVRSSQLNSIAEQLGMDSKLNTLAKFLSFGQMQRVAIIRALNRKYNWLIMDEPFSHLDENNAQIAWNLIKKDASINNAGIIITSLDPYPFILPDKIFIL